MPEYKTLRLDEIEINYAIQPRVNGLNQDHVDELEAAYRNENAVIEPPVVWRLPEQSEGGPYRLSQGFHRVEAAKRAGLKELKFAVYKGSEQDCEVDALTSNKSHGLKRTNADKRRAVERLLKLMGDFSDRAIAERAGVSDPFVGDLRRQLLTVSSSTNGGQLADSASSTNRKGKDGKERKAPKPKADKPKPPENKPTAPEDANAPESPDSSIPADKPKPTITPPAVEPDIEATGKPPTHDALGIPIQPQFAEVFAQVPEFKALVRTLKKAAKFYHKLANGPAGAFLIKRSQFVNRGTTREDGRWRNNHFEELIKTIEDCTPAHTACPYAHNPKAPHTQGDRPCGSCLNTGWAPPLMLNQIPVSIIAATKAAFGVEDAA